MLVQGVIGRHPGEEVGCGYVTVKRQLQDQYGGVDQKSLGGLCA